MLRRRGVLTALVLAVAGFLLGSNWGSLAPLITPVLSGLGTAWASAEKYGVDHPIVTGLATGISVPILGWGFVQLRYVAQRLFRRRSIIDLVFKGEDIIPVVTSHMRQASFQRVGSQQIVQLPSNAQFIPSNVAIGAALIYSYVHNRYAGKKTTVLHFDNENWGSDSHCFISIGGPFVNEIAKEVIEGKRVTDFEITDLPTARDQKDVYEAQRENKSTQPDAALTIDYGFLIYMRNPHNPDKRIIIVFGLWPPGAQAAAAAILNPGKRSDRLVKQLYKAIRKDHNVIGIIRVNVRGLILEEGKLIKVREF